MPTISYGTTAKPITHASGRRKERRKLAAIERDLLESRIYKALGLKPEKRKVLTRIRPTTPPDLKPLQEYQQQIEQAAVDYERSNHLKFYRGFVEGPTCLPEVAVYAAGYRKTRKGATHIVK